jgi:hypothetical protein
MKSIRTIGIYILILVSVFGLLTCQTEDRLNNVINVGESVKGQLLIFQVFGTGDDGGRAVNRTFVELYNSSDYDINLNGASLWFADGNSSQPAKDEPWEKIRLNGIISAKGSFLVTGPEILEKDNRTGENIPAAHMIPNGYGDIENPQFILSNRAFKVALLYGSAELTDGIQNPFNVNGIEVNGYLDMIGVRNDINRDSIYGFETAPARNSRSETVRRRNLIDTDNNQGYHTEHAPDGTGDFISMRYADFSAEEIGVVRPRNAGSGGWDPFGACVTIAGTGINSGTLTIMQELSVTLSARFMQLAETAGLTYSWQITNQTPVGTLTFNATNTPILEITAALAGTATVTLTVSGDNIPNPGLSSSISVVSIGGTESLLILQANTFGNNNGGTAGFPRSAVELYNNTNITINLSTGNYFLHIGTGTAWTHVIKLEGSIPAKHSFLITSNLANEVNNTPSASFPAPDQQAAFAIPNNNFKIAVLINQSSILTIDNPWEENIPGYVDMLGIGSTNGFEKAPFTSQSRPRVPRRISLIDTDDNSTDFGNVDYRGATILFNGEDLTNDIYKVWPRNVTLGAWNPVSGLPRINP